MRALKTTFAALIVVGLVTWAAVAASAQDPKPGEFVFVTDATGHMISSSSPEGYRHPPAAYAVGDTFSYNFVLDNHGVPPAYTDHSTAHDVFIWRIFRLGVDGSTDFTEAQLEAMVHNGHDGGETLVHAAPPQTIDLPNATNVPVTESTTLTAAMAPSGCGYFEFDFRLSTQAVGGTALNSGFIRILPCTTGGTGGITASPSPSPTSTGAAAARLATTGGGPTGGLPWYVLAFLGSLLIALGARLAYRWRS
jgi:hypothetical protein